MDRPRDAARPDRVPSAERRSDRSSDRTIHHTLAEPITLTGLATGAAVAVTTVVAVVLIALTSSATWSPVALLWAAVAGVLAGYGQIRLLTWWLAEPAAQLLRLAELADQADELGRQLAQGAIERSGAGQLRLAYHYPGRSGPDGKPGAGRRRASQLADVPSVSGGAPSVTGSPRNGAATDPSGAGSPDTGTQITGVINQLLTALDAEHSYRSIVEATGDVVLLVDSLGQIALASESVEQVLGFAPVQMVGQPLARYVHAGDLEQLLDLLEHFDAAPHDDRRAQRPRLRLRAADDQWRVLEWVFAPWPVDNSGSTLLTGRDVTEQIQLQQELVYQARHDSLTGLPNRSALIARLTELVAQATDERPIAVLMIDLDRFKVINDSLGHAYGDVLLNLVGARLRTVLRPGDMLARLGGDEFAVVVQTGGLAGAELVAERLVSQLVDPFPVESARLTVEASIGIAISHGPPRNEPADAAILLGEADIAMYRAKEARGSVAVFEPERDQATSRRLALSDELRDGITAGQLVLYYQPIIDIHHARVAGVEALVRWEHPERGLLMPADFLPVAEETGLICRLSCAVLDQALAQLAHWIDQGWALPVSVNLSPNWLHQADVPTEVADALDRHGVPADLLRLEITEASVLVDPQQSLSRLHRLKAMGVGLSLDDFGTGYSSMTHLRTLPIDQLKVDRTFVGTMVTTEQDAVIVRAAIELGHNLGLTVVAEGVEDPDTLARVMGAGCSLAQGYYFAKPMPADDVLNWIEPRFPATADSLAS